MKTSDLIKLNESITQGEWKHDGAGFGNIRPVKETGRNICTFNRQFSNDEWKQVNADAAAIALVPQLLSEAIKLREANEALTRKLDIAYNGLTAVKKITDGSQPKDFPSVPLVAAYVLAELAQ